MIDKIKGFLKLLEMELEDLDADIKILISEYEEKHTRQVISNYVFRENIAVMQNELFGVEGFLQEVRQIDRSDWENLEDLVKELKAGIRARVKQRGIVPAVVDLIDRKITKASAYVSAG